MRSTVTAVVLCTFAAAAAAQCIAQAPVADAAQPGAELIKSAAAGTHQQPLPLDDVVRQTATAAKTGENHPRRGGPAMLLAAVALMSGIALRRFSARMQ